MSRPPESAVALADRLWDWAMKALVPVSLVLAGLIATHDRTINGHEHRLASIERSVDRTTVAVEQLASTMAEIRVLLGRLEERLTLRMAEGPK